MADERAISDLEVRDVVLDMARILEVNYTENNNEISLKIPDKLGTGTIKAISFDHGIGVLDADFLLKKEFVFGLDNKNTQPLKFIFNRESAFIHTFQDTEDVHEIQHLESAIISSNLKHGNVFRMPANKPVCIFSVEVNRKLFEEKIQDFLADLHHDLIDMFRDVNGINLFFYKGYYSLDISRFIEEFTECDLEGFMRSVYQEGKAYEIITHHLQQYIDDLQKPDKRKIIRQSMIERVEKATRIIREEIDAEHLVPELAKRVGLNKNSLQLGFKVLYQMSVNDFIRNERITRAKDLMEQTDLNITEITYKIGINSRSYFSKLFKEKYGMTPTQYLANMRDNNRKSS